MIQHTFQLVKHVHNVAEIIRRQRCTRRHIRPNRMQHPSIHAPHPSLIASKSQTVTARHTTHQPRTLRIKIHRFTQPAFHDPRQFRTILRRQTTRNMHRRPHTRNAHIDSDCRLNAFPRASKNVIAEFFQVIQHSRDASLIWMSRLLQRMLHLPTG